LELCFVEYKMLKHSPSILAAASVYLANKLSGVDEWSQDLIRGTKFEEGQIKNCAKEMAIILQNAEKSALSAVKRKFSSVKLMEVAKMKFAL